MATTTMPTTGRKNGTGSRSSVERFAHAWVRFYLPWVVKHRALSTLVTPTMFVIFFFVFWGLFGLTPAWVITAASVGATALFFAWALLFGRRRRAAIQAEANAKR